MYIFFNWRKSFATESEQKARMAEWPLRLKKSQVKGWNFEAVTYFHSILLFFAFNENKSSELHHSGILKKKKKIKDSS